MQYIYNRLFMLNLEGKIVDDSSLVHVYKYIIEIDGAACIA